MSNNDDFSQKSNEELHAIIIKYPNTHPVFDKALNELSKREQIENKNFKSTASTQLRWGKTAAIAAILAAILGLLQILLPVCCSRYEYLSGKAKMQSPMRYNQPTTKK